MTAVSLAEFCSVLGPTKRVVTEFFFLQRIRYGTVITNYHYLTIVNYKKNSKEINCLKSRSALFSENELLMQQQTTKCPETTVIFNSNLKIFCTF